MTVPEYGVPDYVRMARHEWDLSDDGHEVVELAVTNETDVSLVLAPNGTGGVEFRAETGGGGGGGSLPWFDVTVDGTCVGDGVTDDTAALQSAIDTATASGTRSATLFFPAGTYLIGGALQSTGSFNGQLLLPSVGYGVQQITLVFLGASPPEGAGQVSGGTPKSSDGYSIIKSTLTGASGTAAMFSGGQFSSIGATNNLHPVFRDIVIEVPVNPTFTALNFDNCQNPDLDGVFIYNGETTSVTQPTNSNSYGVKLGHNDTSNYQSLRDVLISGFYTALLDGDKVYARGVRVGNCYRVLEIPFTSHPSDWHIFAAGCTIGVIATGASGKYLNLVYEAEHVGGGWGVTTYDIYDPSSHLFGDVVWSTVQSGGGNAHVLTLSGATNLNIRELGTSAISFATPAVVLGTAAAAGSATTMIRSDSTIVAFDATAPTTSAIGDAAATGSQAKAARRDHVHGREALSTATPLIESGAGTVGTGIKSSREDHVHPSTGSGVTDHEHIVNVVFSGDASATVWELPAAPVSDSSIMVYIAGSRSLAWVLSGALLTTLTFDSAPASASNNIIIDIVAATA